MARYRWSIEFDADDDKDANGQVEEALDAFHSYYSDDLQQIEEGNDG